MNENINKENKKNFGFGAALQYRSHTIIKDNFLQWLFLSIFCQYLGFWDTIWQFFYNFTS